jgi:phosphatidylglycerophosphate synthase
MSLALRHPILSIRHDLEPLTVKQRRWYGFVNLITFLRFFNPFLIIAYCVVVQANEVFAAAILIVIITIFTVGDAFDGAIARKFGVTSKIGDEMDHLSDKLTLVAALAVFIALIATAQFNHGLKQLTVALIVLTIFQELGIALINLKNLDLAKGANKVGRKKYLVQGAGLAAAAIGMTWYYHDPHVLGTLIAITTICLVIALVMGLISLRGYQRQFAAT